MTVFEKGIKAAKLLVSFHLIMKGVNFFLGILIARLMSPEAYGAGHINLSLATSAILHLSRESFRKVALKTKASPFGIMWMSVVLTSILALASYIMSPTTATLIISCAAIIEVLSEPYHISHLISINVKSTIAAESFSTIINCLVVLAFSNLNEIAFCLGQLASSSTHFLVHFIQSKNVMINLQITEEDKSLLKTYTFIGIFKFFLSEGEKIFLTYMAYSSVDRGVFALVSNLSGIVPRIFYAPVEQVTYIVFTKSMTVEEQKQGVYTIIGVMWVFGTLFATYTQIYADVIISVLYADNWKDTDAANALALYGFYIMIMGVFGSGDAIDWAVSSQTQIMNKRKSSTIVFAIFMTSAYFLSDHGATGLILACIFSYVGRLCFCARSNLAHFKWLTIRDMLPDIETVASCLAAYAILRVTKMYSTPLELAGAGVVTLLLHLYVLYYLHKEKINRLKNYKTE